MSRAWVPAFILAFFALASSALAAGELCVEKFDGAWILSGCGSAGKVRVEGRMKAGSASYRGGPMLGPWSVDFTNDVQEAPDPTTGATARIDLKERLKTLSADTPAMESAKAARETQLRTLGSLKVKPGRARTGIEKTPGCLWHRLELPGGKTYADLCVKRYPPAVVREYLEMIDAARKSEKRVFPLVYTGLPLLDPLLPIYRDDGVIESGSLPVRYLDEQGRAFTFDYKVK